MRIVVVSAHFPPDFVSGGTLVPQRQARALRDRGHDVHVYAGSLDPARQDAGPWDEADETGLPVHWVPVRHAIGWADRVNHDDPRAAAQFAGWLEQVRPDVVHLHSLQALGGDLVRVARASGARTVVTMHDFWWSCARQFLVDPDLRPCSLVVQAGVCGCEVDRPWLDARNALLAEALAHADVVCVPSAVARDVAAANGLAPYALVVDENGLPPAAVEPAGADPAVAGKAVGEPAGAVRFLYAGGSDPLKGVHVVLEAADRLRGLPGWTLTAVGAAQYAHQRGWSADGLPVRLDPPYAPTELSGVLRAHDVLIVPSLMRESFSILTREALLHGLAVVCTDTLGPEEVVDHGRNGLVVTAGSSRDLGAAMRRLVQDPAELRRLRSAPAPVVRTLAEQVDGLERTYAATATPRPESTVRRVLFVCGIEGAPLRYRARLPAEALALHGVHTDVRHYRDPELARLAALADAVVLYRVPATVQVLELVAQVRTGSAPVLFDVDDLVFDPDLAQEIPALRVLGQDESALWLDGVRRYRTTLEASDAYVGSTQLLCEHATAVTGLPAYRFANGVGIVTARRSDAALRRPRRPGPLRVGYLSGTTTHDRDWQSVEPAVLEVLARHPGSELWLVGHLTPTGAVDALGERLHRLPLQDWRDLPGLLRDLDVNLAPLESSLGGGGRFNEAKSAIKQLEAALVETPTVATPTQPFREAVTHGVNGLLATTHEQWVAALDDLLSDPALRSRLGGRARRDALLSLSPHLQGARYLAVLEQARAAVAAGRPDRRSPWVPVAPDEPPVPVLLEPYTAEPVRGPGPAAVLAARARTYRVRAAHLWQREGAAGTARATGRVAARLARRAGSRAGASWRRRRAG